MTELNERIDRVEKAVEALTNRFEEVMVGTVTDPDSVRNSVFGTLAWVKDELASIHERTVESKERKRFLLRDILLVAIVSPIVSGVGVAIILWALGVV